MSRVGKRQSEVAVKTALENGITLFDTAPMYGQGQSEQLLGRMTREYRERITICTKVGQVVPAHVRMLLPLKPLVRALISPFRATLRTQIGGIVTAQTQSQKFDPSSITRSVEESLRRLRVERLDIVLLHSPAPEVIRRGEFVKVLNDLRVQGKLRYFGISCEGGIESVLAAAALPKGSFQVVQIEISEELFPALKESLILLRQKGVGIIGRAPIASMKWALTLDEVDSVLVGMTSVAHIQSNCRLCDGVDEGGILLQQRSL